MTDLKIPRGKCHTGLPEGHEGTGTHRLLVSAEEVWKGREQILSRPDPDDKNDVQLLTETHLEQTRANSGF